MQVAERIDAVGTARAVAIESLATGQAGEGKHKHGYGPFILKELRLHRPSLLLGACLIVLWLGIDLHMFLFNRPHHELVMFLGLISGCYVLLAVILAGCISIGEETRLGLLEWHLTFPAHSWRLYLIKAGVSFLVTLAIAVLLPALLGFISVCLRVGTAPVSRFLSDAWPIFIYVFFLWFLSFWAATFLRDTIRATLAAVATAVVAALITGVGAWMVNDANGFQRFLLVHLVAYMQTPAHEIVFRLGKICVGVWVVVMSVLLFWQGLRAFTKNRHGVPTFLRNSGVTIAVVVCLSVWTTDLLRSAGILYGSILQNDLIHATLALPDAQTIKVTRSVGLQELKGTGRLSAVTARWIRNSTFTLQPTPKNNLTLTIRFPSGKEDQIIAHRSTYEPHAF